MGTYTETGFQMFCMHQQSYEVITVSVQSEKYSHSYVIDSSFHGTVHCFRMISVVAFWPGGMEGFVVLFVICFLK